MDAVGPAALRAIHQRVGPVDQFGRELARDAAALRDGPEAETDNPDVHLNWTRREAAVLPRPVVRFDGLLETSGDLGGLDATRKVGNQKTELVAAESRVKIACLAGTFEREEVLRPDLIGQEARDALDDAIADGMPERVVVPLEAGDVDDPDAAPADALFDGEERFEALHEPVEVEQLRLGIPV